MVLLVKCSNVVFYRHVHAPEPYITCNFALRFWTCLRFYSLDVQTLQWSIRSCFPTWELNQRYALSPSSSLVLFSSHWILVYTDWGDPKELCDMWIWWCILLYRERWSTDWSGCFSWKASPGCMSIPIHPCYVVLLQKWSIQKLFCVWWIYYFVRYHKNWTHN